MNFDNFDLRFYRVLLVCFFTAIFVPLLFDIGEQYPAYTFTAWTWLVGVALGVVPAWIGYVIGRAAERAEKGEGNG